jgi:hypothetical protein
MSRGFYNTVFNVSSEALFLRSVSVSLILSVLPLNPLKGTLVIDKKKKLIGYYMR